MPSTPHGGGRFWAAVLLGLLFAVPAELHATLVEIGAHDVEGPVAVDARHARQAAHVEHSTVELHGRCTVCVPNHPSKALLLRALPWQHCLLLAGRPVARDPLDRGPGRFPSTLGRAPPLP